MEKSDSTLSYLDWEGEPVILLQDTEGIPTDAYIHRRTGWEKFDPMFAFMGAKIVRDKATFDRMFPNLPDPPTNKPEQPKLTLPMSKALDVGHSQPTTGPGADATRKESLEGSLRSKASVDYEHPAKGSQHCGECKHFRKPDRCELVQPPIAAEDWCRLWRQK